MRFSVFSCCMAETWHRLKENKEGMKKLLRELKKGDITLHRFIPFYPRPLPAVKKGLYLAPWKLKKDGRTWKYDLEDENTDFWANWLEFVQTFHYAGITPVISLFDYCHRFDPRDRQRSPFTRNIQGVDMLNPRDPEGWAFLIEFIRKQILLVKDVLGINEFYVEIGNEFFKEKGCCPKGSEDCKPTHENWCSHEAVQKLGKYLVSALGIKRSQIIVPTGYKGGDYFHNTGIFGFEGAHAKYRDFHPDFHLGVLKRKPPSWEGWEDREWKNFLNDFWIYFSTDGLGKADLPPVKERVIHVYALNWALRQTNKVFAVEVQPGFFWKGEYEKDKWGCLGYLPENYFKWIRDNLSRKVEPHKTCLCGVFDFIDNDYHWPEPEPEPEPQPAVKPWWVKLWEWIKRILGL